jgi:hypothetical protein
MYSVDLSWQRLVGLATFKENKQYGAIQTVTDRRISNHFRLFSRFLSFKTYFIIAHRNFLTIYDLSVIPDAETKEMVTEHF